MSSERLLNVTFITTLIVALSLAALFTAEMSITSKTALAQIPPAPSVPDGGDLTTENQLSDSTETEPLQSTITTSIPTPTIQITSHEDRNQVPVGELTIQGTSSDNGESNCQVYTDVNDITPLQNATAAGANGGEDDYSRWTFTYTEDYQLIIEGANELTAKISCFDDGGTTTPLSEWHSVNVTGVAGGDTTTPTMRQTPMTIDTLEAEQGVNIIPAPVTPPSPPVTTMEGPLEDSSQGQAEGGEQSGEDDDRDDDDDDDGEEDDR